jgi:hypothetical protein
LEYEKEIAIQLLFTGIIRRINSANTALVSLVARPRPFQHRLALNHLMDLAFSRLINPQPFADQINKLLPLFLQQFSGLFTSN